MIKGSVNIPLALILLAFAILSSIVLNGIIKDVVDTDQRLTEYLDRTYSRIIIMSHANIWKKFLSENIAFWDLIHNNETATVKTSSRFSESKLEIKLSNFADSLMSTYESVSVSEHREEMYLVVSYKMIKNGQTIPFSAELGFGWLLGE